MNGINHLTLAELVQSWTKKISDIHSLGGGIKMRVVQGNKDYGLRIEKLYDDLWMKAMFLFLRVCFIKGMSS